MVQVEDIKSTASSSDEPRCLVAPESKWYRPGQGFTCRQIMLPLMVTALLLVGMLVLQISHMSGSGEKAIADWGKLMVYVVAITLIIKSLFFVRRSLIDPLTQIRHWVSRVCGGEYAARIPKLARGEFNELAIDINILSDLIEKLHTDLESEVAVQTEKLALKSQALELLYEVATSVNEEHQIEELLTHFMHRLGEVFHAEAVVVRVLKDSRLELVNNYGLGSGSSFLEPSVPMKFVYQNNLFGRDTIGIRTETINEVLSENISERKNQSIRQVISIPLQYRDSILGMYQIFTSTDTEIDDDTKQLQRNIGQHLGVALEQSRLDQDTSRLIMVEERAKLANELHDSLAQTLASLRFQVRVLDETLHQGDEQVTWEELEKLEDKVEVANHELRSLIGQFRAPYQSQEVVVAVKRLVEKFRQDTGTTVYFQNEWTKDDLNPEMRNNVVRIIQEALTNIRKHANANTVRVIIRHLSGSYKVIVEDDGIGFDETKLMGGGSGEHIGRQIMLERANNLGASFKLDTEVGEGSRVELVFEDQPEPSSQNTVETLVSRQI